MQESKETPAKCALGGGNHPANYRGCQHYRNLIKGKTRLEITHSTSKY